MKTSLAFALGLVWLVGVAGCGDGPNPVLPTPIAATGSNPSLPGGGTTLAYVQDIKPILDADCVQCHNTRTQNGRVDVSSFAAVRRTLTPGNANSELIRVTRRGGSMYREWRGDADAKAELVRRWIVEFQAVENR